MGWRAGGGTWGGRAVGVGGGVWGGGSGAVGDGGWRDVGWWVWGCRWWWVARCGVNGLLGKKVCGLAPAGVAGSPAGGDGGRRRGWVVAVDSMHRILGSISRQSCLPDPVLGQVSACEALRWPKSLLNGQFVEISTPEIRCANATLGLKSGCGGAALGPKSGAPVHAIVPKAGAPHQYAPQSGALTGCRAGFAGCALATPRPPFRSQPFTRAPSPPLQTTARATHRTPVR